MLVIPALGNLRQEDQPELNLNYRTNLSYKEDPDSKINKLINKKKENTVHCFTWPCSIHTL